MISTGGFSIIPGSNGVAFSGCESRTANSSFGFTPISRFGGTYVFFPPISIRVRDIGFEVAIPPTSARGGRR